MIEQVARLLRQSGLTVATAESCTGGLIGGALTQVSGSSDYYAGGVISYSNAVKENLLGVRHDTLQTLGAVSAEVAGQMADGARRKLETDLGISTTGIAGPEGGAPEKPVGLVYIGLADAEDIQAREFRFAGERDAVRRQTVQAALDWVCSYLGQRKGEH